MKGYSEGEKYIKRVIKKKRSFSISLLVTFLISGIVGFSLPVFAARVNLQIDTANGEVKRITGPWGKESVILAPTDNNKNKQNSVVVIGAGAEVKSQGATAIGYHALGQGNQATAVGQSAVAREQAVAVGSDTFALGEASIAIGGDDISGIYPDKLPKATIKKLYSALYTGNDKVMNESTFIDKYIIRRGEDQRKYSPTFSKGKGAIAIGTRTVAFGDGTTALGTLSFALGDRSTAIGLRAFVNDGATGGTAIGEESIVFAKNSIAVGNKTEAAAEGAMSYGYKAKAVGDGSISIGHTTGANAQLTEESKNQFIEKLKELHKNGDNFKDIDDNHIVSDKGRTGNNSTAVNDKLSEIKNIGFQYEETGDVVFETDREIKKTGKKGDNSIAVGRNSFSNGNNSISMGSGVGVFGDNSVGIGALTYIGDDAYNTVALGTGAYAEKQNNVVIGTSAQSSGESSVLIGTGATSAGNNTIVIGTGANIKGNDINNSVAIGKGASVSKSSSLSLGNEAKAELENSVALGYRSTTLYNYAEQDGKLMPTLNGGTDASQQPGYVPVGSTYKLPVDNSAGVISVGGWQKDDGQVGLRRIINVSPGFLDTDVATVGQLKALSYVKNEGNLVYYTKEDNGTIKKLVKGTDGKFYEVNTASGEPLNSTAISEEKVFAGIKGFGEEKDTKPMGNSIVLGNLKDGTIGQNSDTAITGGQLYKLEKEILGLEIQDNVPTLGDFKKLKDKNGNDATDTLTTFKDVINKNIEKINEGLTFGADQGNETKQFLGSKVKVTTNESWGDGANKYVGDNLETSYSNNGGDGVIKIGLKESPTFKTITVQDSATISSMNFNKDNTITGLSNTTWNNGNSVVDNRAATEGQLKGLSDDLNNTITTGLTGKADTSLGNIDTTGTNKIKEIAVGAIGEAVDVRGTDGIIVTPSEENKKKIFTAKLDGAKVKELAGTTALETEYAKADASNIQGDETKVNAWKNALGVADLDLSYKSGKAGEQAKTTSLKNGLTFKSDDKNNIDITTEGGGIVKYGLSETLKGITSISNGTNGTGTILTLNNNGVSLNSKTITGLSNITWDENNVDTSRAATEGQIQKAVGDVKTLVNGNTTKIQTLEAGLGKANENWKIAVKNEEAKKVDFGDTVKFNTDDNLDISAANTDKEHTLTIKLKDNVTVGGIAINSSKNGGTTYTNSTITGLTNTTWNKDSIENSRAATEGQLKGLSDDLNSTISTGLAGKADKDLGNIGDAGTKVIKDIAVGAIGDAVDVKAKENSAVTVDKTKEGTKNIFTVGLNDTKLEEKYVKKDGTNIDEKDKEKWKEALGVADLNLRYKAEGEEGEAKTTTLSQGLTFKNEDSNINVITETGGVVKYALNTNLTGIASISNNGTTISLNGDSVGFGNKKLSNVAKGTADSDAVNISQLKDALKSLGGGATVGADGSVTQPTYNLNIGENTPYKNVGDALTAVDTAIGGLAKKDLSNIDETGKEKIKSIVGETVSVEAKTNSGVVVETDTTTTQGKTVYKVGLDTKELTDNIKNSEENKKAWQDALNLSYKSGQEQAKTTSLSKGLTFNGDKNITVTAKGEGVIGFALNGKLKGITSISSSAEDNGTGTTLTLNDTGLDLGGKKLTGLGEGTVDNSSTDAVTGKQLYEVKTSVDGNKQSISTINNTLENVNKSWKLAVKEEEAQQVPFDSTVRFKTDDNLDINKTNGNNENVVTIGLKDNVTIGGISVKNIKNGDTTYSESTITGLTNTTWNGTSIQNDRAATEGQLKNVSDTLNNTITTGLAEKADKDLGNIDETGKEVIKNTAIEAIGKAVDVKGNNGIKVTQTKEDKKTVFTASLETDKVKELAGTTNLETNYAKTDASNISEENKKKWKDALGVSNLDLSYKSKNGETKTTTLSNGLTFNGDKNITITAKDNGEIDYTLSGELKGITSITNSSDGNGGTKITINDEGVDLGGKKLTGLTGGTVGADSKEAVTGGQLFETKTELLKSLGDTKIYYTANSDTNKKSVLLSKGLDFTSGTNTNVEVGDDGVVKYNLNTTLTGITSISNNGTTITLNSDNVDFGNKKLSNIAKGTADTDAVNLSQLKPLVTALGGGASVGTDGTVTQPTYSLKAGNKTATDYENVEKALEAVDTAIGNAANKDLTDLSEAAQGEIKKLAIGAVEVKAKENSGITVTTPEAKDENKKIYEVGLDENKIKQITGTTALETDYAKADASNIKGENVEKWKTALGVSDLGSTNLSYKANDQQAKTVALKDGLNFKNGANTTAKVEDNGVVIYDLNSTLTGISSISNNGTTITLNADNVSFGNKKLSNVAKGTADDDAVNLSQLKPLVETLGGGASIGTDGSVTKPTYTLKTGDKTENNNYNTIEEALQAVDKAIDANKNLDGITDKGKEEIKKLAIGAVDVKAKENSAITVTSAKAEDDENKKIFTVGIDEAEVKKITGTTNLSTEYAKADASNIKGNTENINKWKEALGVADLNLRYKAVGEEGEAKTTTLSTGLTFNGDKNITVNTEDGGKVNFVLNGELKGITTISSGADGKDGTTVTITEKGLDLGGKTITNLGKGDATTKGSTDAVTGGQLFETNEKVKENTSSIDTIKENLGSVNESWKLAVNQAGAEKVEFGKTIRFKTDENLSLTPTNVNNEKVLTLALKDNIKIGGVTVANTKDGDEYNSSTITGLTNTTWDKDNIDESRAATEGQLGAVITKLDDKTTGLNTKVDKDLSNLTEKGENTIKSLAMDAIDVQGEDGITVTLEEDDNAKTFVVGLDEAEVKKITGTTNLEKEYAKADGTNLTEDNKTAWRNALDLSYKSGTEEAKKVSLEKGLTFNGDKNITIETKADGIINYTLNGDLKGITSISNKEDGTGTTVTITDDGLDLGGKKLTGLAGGDVSANSNEAVTGDQLHKTNETIRELKENLGNTELSYAANGGEKQKVSLSNGLNFKDGTNTTASVADNGAVVYDLKEELAGITSISNGKSGDENTTITLNTDNVGFGNKRLSGISNGKDKNDAVNMEQFTKVVEALGGGASVDKNTGKVTPPTYALKTGNETAKDYDNIGDALNAVDKAIDKAAKVDASNIDKDKYIEKLSGGANIDTPTGALVTDTNVKEYFSEKIKDMDIGGGEVAEGDKKTVTGETVHKYLTENYYDKNAIDNKVQELENSVGDVALDVSADKGNEKVNLKNDKIAFKGDKNITTSITASEDGKTKNVNIALNKEVELEKVSIVTPKADNPAENDSSKTITFENGNIVAGAGDNKIEIDSSKGSIVFGEKPTGEDKRLVINGKDGRISNLSDAKEDSDAVTKGQMDKAIEKGSNSKITFTNNEGEQIAKAADGKYYKKDEIKNGNAVAGAKEVALEETKTTLVNREGDTQKPVRLGNVAAGKAENDAVNVGQLQEVYKEVNQNMGTLARGIESNSRRIDKLERSHKKGVANAMATAGVKFQEIQTNEYSLGAAVGYYKDQGAVAVGIQGAPRENLRVHGIISATPGTHAEAAASVGFSWKFRGK